MEWGNDIYKAIKEAGVDQVAYVPDAGHKILCLLYTSPSPRDS